MSTGDMSTSPGLPTPGHAAYDELTVGFALDALEPGEEELLLAHLPECARCQDALISHLEVAASLAYALPMELPDVSPELAEAFRSRPTQLPADPFRATGPVGHVPSQAARRALPRFASRTVVSRQARRVLVGAGALGIVAAVGLSGYDVHLRSGHATSAPSAAAALNAITERGATIAHLSGDQASGTAVVADGHTYLVATGLKQTNSKSAFVVWELKAKPVAIKSFSTVGGAAQVVDLGVATSMTPQKYAVTLEKASSTLPSSPSGAYVLQQDIRSS